MVSGYRFMLYIMLSLFSISFVSAALLHSGDYLSGELFNASNTTFRILGADRTKFFNNLTNFTEYKYDSVLIRSSVDGSIAVQYGKCYTSSRYTYCYNSSSIDMEDVRTFDTGYLEPKFRITLAAAEFPDSDIIFSRNTRLSAYCGEPVNVLINATNSGNMDSRLYYIENLPAAAFVTSTNFGDVTSNSIRFNVTIYSGRTVWLNYTFNNVDCNNKTWSAIYYYTTRNETLTGESNITLETLETYKIVDSINVNKTNSLENPIRYSANLTNKNPRSIYVNLHITADGMTSSARSTNVNKALERYSYSRTLSGNDSLYIDFMPSKYGNYKIIIDGTITLDSKTYTYESSKEVQVAESQVTPAIDYVIQNDTMTLSVTFSNHDVNNSYHNIYGILKGLGDEPVSFTNITPDSKIVYTRHYNMSDVADGKKIHFTGLYRDKNGVSRELYSEITVNTLMLEGSSAAQANITDNPDPEDGSQGPNEDGADGNIASATINITNASSQTDNSTSSGDSDKDFITGILEGISNFLSSIFG